MKSSDSMSCISLFLLIPIAILFGSCSSKVLLKEELIEKVEIGMTVQEVKSILGDPDLIKSSSIDSCNSYYYYIKNNSFNTKSAVVKFDKSGYVRFKFFGNPS